MNGVFNDVFQVTDELLSNIKESIKISITYEMESGKPIINTGEIGEVLIAKALGLRLFKSGINVGYDALDQDDRRVQIKTRRIKDMPNTHPNIGVFSDHEFDYAIYVQLDEKYTIESAWRAEFLDIENMITEKKNKYDSKHIQKHNAEQEKLKADQDLDQRDLPLDERIIFEAKPFVSKFKRQLTINEFLKLPRIKIL